MIRKERQKRAELKREWLKTHAPEEYANMEPLLPASEHLFLTQNEKKKGWLSFRVNFFRKAVSGFIEAFFKRVLWLSCKMHKNVPPKQAREQFNPNYHWHLPADLFMVNNENIILITPEGLVSCPLEKCEHRPWRSTGNYQRSSLRNSNEKLPKKRKRIESFLIALLG